MSEQEINVLQREMVELRTEHKILWQEHKKQSEEKWSALYEELRTIHKKLDGQMCSLHSARMLQIDQDISSLTEKVLANQKWIAIATGVILAVSFAIRYL